MKQLARIVTGASDAPARVEKQHGRLNVFQECVPSRLKDGLPFALFAQGSRQAARYALEPKSFHALLEGKHSVLDMALGLEKELLDQFATQGRH